MKRGEIWWVNFDPAIGGEIKKTRPAIIVSNDAANTHLNRVQVIPLTSVTKKIYPSECVVSVNGILSKAMADQIMTVSKVRLTNQLCTITKEESIAVDRIMCLQLGIDVTRL